MFSSKMGSRALCKNIIISVRSFSQTREIMTNKHYDIVIAGGGMIGTTLSCILGKNPKLSTKKILLLEGGKESEWKLPPTYGNRVSTLNSASVELLDGIGAWKSISQARIGPVKRMQVWDAISDATITFNHDNLDEPIAYVVENDLIINSVYKQTKNLENVEVLYQSKIQNCYTSEQDKLVKIALENGTKYTCNLLLGCDGANSSVRKSMGLHYISHNYNHMGIVATLKLPEDFDNVVAWQRQLPNSGFLALLPLTKGLSSLVWSTNSNEAKILLKLSEEEFVDAINDALCRVYPKHKLIDQAMKSFDNFARFLNLPSSSAVQLPPKIMGCDITSRAAFPLGSTHATNYVAPGVALVGDAAHRVHPLAGQGVNLGFGDVICLNQVLENAVYSGSKIEDIHHLKLYETERQRHNIPVMFVVHSMFQLYSSEFTPLVLLRSLGLQATHAFSPLKKLIISEASGARYSQQ